MEKENKKKNKNKKGFSFDFKNLSKEDKTKYGAFGVMFLIFCGFMWYGMSNYSDGSDKENVEFSTPEAELGEYNNKVDALNSNEKITNTGSGLEHTFTTTEENKDEGFNFEQLDRQLAGIGQQSQNQPAPNQAQNQPAPSNSHDVYGDYNMWQTQEPTRSNIGYKNAQKRPKVVKSKEIVYDEVPTDVGGYSPPPSNNYNSYSNDRKSIAQAKQIPAQLISQGEIQEGRVLTFTLKEPAVIAGQSLPKNFPIQGVASFENNRIMVTFNAINVNKKLYPVNIQLLDSNGIEGIGIIGAKEKSDIEDQVANQATSRIPVIGGIINSARKKNTNVRSVKAQPTTVYLLVHNK